MDSRIRLLSAHEAGTLVRVFRPDLESGWARGYVAAVGSDLFAIRVVDDGIRFDGFNCLRFEDVTQVDAPAPHAEFVERVIAMRGLEPPVWPALDLSSMGDLLRSLETLPMVSLHSEDSEDVDEGVCYVGRVQRVTAETVDVLEITPDGRWDPVATEHFLEDITRVDFGGAYEEALQLAAVASSRG